MSPQQKKHTHPITAQFKYIMSGGDNTLDLPKAWNALGYVDTISHAHRLQIPVLLTSGSEDLHVHQIVYLIYIVNYQIQNQLQMNSIVDMVAIS